MVPTPSIDLVLVFRSSYPSLNKKEKIIESSEAQEEYRRLLDVLRNNGFLATGRRGGSQGEILILVHAPWEKIEELAKAERHSDFLFGLPTAEVPSHIRDVQIQPLTPAGRLRLIYSYINATTVEGGLGLVPSAHDYPRLQCTVALHDRKFNEKWIHDWTRRQIGFGFSYRELVKIRDQFGEGVAFYFAFLSAYTKSLVFPAVIGTGSFLVGRSYDLNFSFSVVLWSIIFVEWWRIRELVLSVRWGSLGAVRVEKRRPQFRGDKQTSNDPEKTFPWWKRELRIISSIPVILTYACVLVIFLTSLFVFEAFVTQLYTGPGTRFASFSPTVLFIAFIPRILALYNTSAIKLTNWENHFRQSSYDYSLTIKTFALSGIVAYSGLALSAFVYIPYHEQVMTLVHNFIFSAETTSTNGLMETSILQARSKVNPNRLQDQMFAFTVTSQVINFFMEVVLPVALRKARDLNATSTFHGKKKKRVGFDDQLDGSKEEREFLDDVRHQVALPDYTTFGDYNEMAIQFGYVAMWSTIWPLAPLMAFLNNWFEARGDAFKIVRSCRRPLPQRVETIGPWLEVLGFISWMAALSNAALVYMFEPRVIFDPSTFSGKRVGTVLDPPAATVNLTSNECFKSSGGGFNYSSILFPALMISLSSSHAYILTRLIIRHLLQRAIWKGSKEEIQAKEADAEIKRLYIRNLVASNVVDDTSDQLHNQGKDAFWERDDGAYELQCISKEA